PLIAPTITTTSNATKLTQTMSETRHPTGISHFQLRPHQFCGAGWSMDQYPLPLMRQNYASSLIVVGASTIFRRRIAAADDLFAGVPAPDPFEGFGERLIVYLGVGVAGVFGEDVLIVIALFLERRHHPLVGHHPIVQ